MAATEMTPQAATITGTALTAYAPELTDGNTFANSGTQKIIVANNSGGTLTFTAVTTYTVENTLTLDDRNYSIDDGDTVYIGVFTQGIYGTEVTLNNFSAASGVVIYTLN